MTFDVYVVDEDGQPQEGRRVHCSFPYDVIFLGTLASWLEEFTDEDGHASFDTGSDHDKVTITVGDFEETYPLHEGAGYTVEI